MTQETVSAGNGFAVLGLPEILIDTLDSLNFTTPTPIQAEAIPHVLAGRDILGEAQTGTGKTAAFGLPALARIDCDKRAAQLMVLAPTRELAIQVAKALEEFPTFNSSLSEDGASLILKKYVHLGIAVDTPNGLVVPVVRDVNKKGIIELSRELQDISVKAREGKLTASDMQGGCFTISSLGGIGGTAFTPIVNAPEVAILGVSKSDIKPKWNGKEFEPKLMLPLSVSYDHRVIDGALAARFTATLAGYLADIRQIIM